MKKCFKIIWKKPTSGQRSRAEFRFIDERSVSVKLRYRFVAHRVRDCREHHFLQDVDWPISDATCCRAPTSERSWPALRWSLHGKTNRSDLVVEGQWDCQTTLMRILFHHPINLLSTKSYHSDIISSKVPARNPSWMDNHLVWIKMCSHCASFIVVQVMSSNKCFDWASVWLLGEAMSCREHLWVRATKLSDS